MTAKRLTAKRHYREVMSARAACGKTTGPDSSSWSNVGCAACLARQIDLALAFARYCGTEYEANLEASGLMDYLDDIAGKFGVATWRELPAEHKKRARQAFDLGRVAERKAQRE
jgi:hypothetical protein